MEDILKEYKGYLRASHLVDLSLPVHVYLNGFEEDGLKISVAVRALDDIRQ